MYLKECPKDIGNQATPGQAKMKGSSKIQRTFHLRLVVFATTSLECVSVCWPEYLCEPPSVNKSQVYAYILKYILVCM